MIALVLCSDKAAIIAEMAADSIHYATGNATTCLRDIQVSIIDLVTYLIRGNIFTEICGVYLPHRVSGRWRAIRNNISCCFPQPLPGIMWIG